ncbi:MAG: RNA polymerase sigma factor [Bacillota bacterium]
MATILEDQSEAGIINAAKAGNSDAFGSLYDAYIKKIYNFVYYKTLNQENAEDITSTVFIKAWEKLSQFQDGNFGAWLYAIARNAVVDFYRREKPALDIEDCWDLSDGQDFLGSIDRVLEISKVKEAMSSLRVQEREILIMRFWQELSFQEIGERLGKNEGAVKMAASRALKALKTKIPFALFLLLPGILQLYARK